MDVRIRWTTRWTALTAHPPEDRSGGRGWPGPRTRGPTMEPSPTEPPRIRRRLGFSEIPRNVRRIVYANVLGGVGFGYLIVFITAYLPQIGIGPEIVGLLLGAEGVSMVLIAIPLGWYSDRRGRKGLLLVG